MIKTTAQKTDFSTESIIFMTLTLSSPSIINPSIEINNKSLFLTIIFLSVFGIRNIQILIFFCLSLEALAEVTQLMNQSVY